MTFSWLRRSIDNLNAHSQQLWIYFTARFRAVAGSNWLCIARFVHQCDRPPCGTVYVWDTDAVDVTLLLLLSSLFVRRPSALKRGLVLLDISDSSFSLLFRICRSGSDELLREAQWRSIGRPSYSYLPSSSSSFSSSTVWGDDERERSFGVEQWGIIHGSKRDLREREKSGLVCVCVCAGVIGYYRVE